MKKLILLAGFYCLQPTLHAGIPGKPDIHNLAPISANDRALRHFKSNYTDVQDAVWSNSKNGEIFCTFQKEGIRNWVFYDSRGYWKYQLMGYTASYLDPSVKDMVLSSFLGYHISFVHEIRSANYEPVYVVNIEDEDNIKVIQVSNNGIEVKQDLIKR